MVKRTAAGRACSSRSSAIPEGTLVDFIVAYPALASLLRNSVVPTGLIGNFPLHPAFLLAADNWCDS
jgi:hypothetical protein